MKQPAPYLSHSQCQHNRHSLRSSLHRRPTRFRANQLRRQQPRQHRHLYSHSVVEIISQLRRQQHRRLPIYKLVVWRPNPPLCSHRPVVFSADSRLEELRFLAVLLLEVFLVVLLLNLLMPKEAMMV